jgi:hypothetical protein
MAAFRALPASGECSERIRLGPPPFGSWVMSKSALKIVEYAIVEVTESINV